MFATAEDEIAKTIEGEERKAGLSRTASLSEDLVNWYYSEVRAGRVSDPFSFLLTLKTNARRASLDAPFEYGSGEMKRKYKSLRASGLSNLTSPLEV